ncbi:pyruvate carboxyltransferase [Butyrivibrio fibrisolvens]|uniref:pyruvate carboxyltransferase n=1 Tax=Butyrivibrio fibrisolvens TaxID=831 RepID=UPI0003B50217|nr:pyruvate carboxyltransferase [Butyrivibrio fibrisolvens]
MKILDTTIRDGSYAVDFKFSCSDVKMCARAVERLGIPYFEIGHGRGLGASNAENGFSLNTDEEYMKTARENLKNTKFGFFCIPGVASFEDIDLLAANGGSFVRIGDNADQIEDTIPYIEHAKKKGLMVTVNYMKTYIIEPEEFAAKAVDLQKAGADCVYVVDSAGCMLEADILAYKKALREKSDIAIGYHGHNNIGLAVSNSLACAKDGFDIIDTSFQGLGRSIGNTATEMFVMSALREGIDVGTDIDIPRLLESGFTFIRNATDRAPQNPLDLICGYAGFHSGYLKDIYKCSEDKNVDPLRLIIAYADKNQKSMDLDLLYKVAETLPVDTGINPYSFRQYFKKTYSVD